jgi:hypothetical protein
MHKDTTYSKAGKIEVKQGKKGTEFYAFNHQHGKPLHIGTLCGRTYEKTAPILQKPEPSFCLPQSELGAVIEHGAEFIRFIGRGRPGTFCISVQDFQRHGEPYFNQSYGPQIRVSLTCPKLQHSLKVQKRNSITDNPPVEVAAPIIKPKEKDQQTSFFDRWMK